MDSRTKLIPLHLHPMGFIEAFTQLGADLKSLLQDTGIHQGMFDVKGAKISYEQQKRLVRNGIALCRRPGLGLLVGQLFDWTYHGTVGSIVYCSPSLRDAGEAFQRYAMIAQPFYSLYPRQPTTYVDEKGIVVHPLRHFPYSRDKDEELLRFETEYRLAVGLRIWDMCGNKSVPDPSVRVGLAYPEPAHVHLYRQLPCHSIEFNCEQSYIAVHKSFVLEPFRLLRRHAYNLVIERCEEELRAADLEVSYTSKVRWHVYAHFNKQVSLEKVAETLRATPRTLTRRLAAEGTTFRDILHNVRMELTAHHLRSSKLSIDEVAELMGFSSVSSMRRAIRNWTGDTVSTVRPAAPARPVAEEETVEAIG